jgi:hypothetical protein
MINPLQATYPSTIFQRGKIYQKSLDSSFKRSYFEVKIRIKTVHNKNF